MEKHIGFDGEEILERDWAYLQSGKEGAIKKREQDFWTDGILKDGISNFFITVDGTTTSLINVGVGAGYISGERMGISSNQTYNASAPFTTTDGICTPQSTGNRGIPLSSYTLGTDNYVWLEYLQGLNTFPFAIHPITSQKFFPQANDSYRIVVNTTNDYANQQGLTNALFLGSVTAQGVGNPLSNNDIDYTGRRYTGVAPTLEGLCLDGRGLFVTTGAVNASLQGGCFGTLLVRDTKTNKMAPFGKGGIQGFRYRHPKLIWNGPTSVEIEPNTDGLCESTVMFYDGEVRTVAENIINGLCNHRLFKTYTTAQFTAGTENSGIRSGVGLTYNNWLAMYAVKSKIDSTKFVLSGDSTPPTKENIPTLNAAYGDFGWRYLGTIRLGLNDEMLNRWGSTISTDIVNFKQQGPLFQFYPYNTKVFQNPVSPAEIIQMTDGQMSLGGAFVSASIPSTASANIVLYNYAVGMQGTQIPPNITFTNVNVAIYAADLNNTVTIDYKHINVRGVIDPPAVGSYYGTQLNLGTNNVLDDISAIENPWPTMSAVIQSYYLQLPDIRFGVNFVGPLIGEHKSSVQINAWDIRKGVQIIKETGTWPGGNHSAQIGVSLTGYVDDALTDTFGGPGF